MVFHAPSSPGCSTGIADVAQLVEHHLAKVRVAGSNPVVRSERPSPYPLGEASTSRAFSWCIGGAFGEDVSIVVEWPRGEATDCKSVYTGSNPVPTSKLSSRREKCRKTHGRLAQW